MKKMLQKTLALAAVLLLIFAASGLAQQNVKVLDLTGNTYTSGVSYYVASGEQMDVTSTWTFEGWLYVDSRDADTYPVIMDRRTVFSWYLIDGASGGDYTVRFVARNSSDVIIASLRCDGIDGSSATQMNYDTWYHIAVSRDGASGVTRLFIDGNQKHSSTDADFVLSTGSAINYGARYWGSYSRFLDGALDEMHMSDAARYTSNFTITQSSLPQTADGSTVLLFNYDNSDLTNSATKNSYTATANGTLVYSNWDFLTDDLPLPVELSSFNTSSVNGKVILKWTTASELNNQGFIIQRSSEKEGTYIDVDSYQSNSALRGAGSVSHSTEYSYIDKNVLVGETLWYTLVSVDMNGVREVFGPVSVVVNENNIHRQDAGTIPETYSLSQNFPNPFNPSTSINFNLPATHDESTLVKLNIYDLQGRLIQTVFRGYMAAGSYQFTWNGKNAQGLRMASGVYIYSLETSAFNMSKKMMLVQ